MSINLVYIGSSRLFLIGLNVKYFQPCGSFGLLFSKWAWLACFLVKSLSHVWLFVTPWTVAYQAPPSMGFSRQECWSGLPFPSPGDLPEPGIEPGSPALQADALPSEPPGIHQGAWLLLLLLSCFSRVRLCVTPETAAHQASLSLGFSRQGHWCGLPFPSPVQESEKWKWSRSVVSDSSRPHGLQPTRLLCPWDFLGKSTGVGCHWLLLRRWIWR